MENNLPIIMIPSYEPTETLISLCSKLKEEGFDLLIIDDGSGAKYKKIFAEAAQFGHLISYEINGGKGYALKTGMKYLLENDTTHKYFITVDGDGQHSIEDIKKMSDMILEDGQIIIGERHFEGDVPPKSLIGNWMSKIPQSIFTLRYLNDNQCGLRAFPVTDIPWMLKINQNRYQFEMTVISIILTKEKPFETMQVQTIYEDNNSGTHFRAFFDMFLIQCAIAQYAIIPILAFILEIFMIRFFSVNIFQESSAFLEISLLIGVLIGIVFQCVVSAIFYRPVRPGKMIFRNCIYKSVLALGSILFIELFSRLAGLGIEWSYLIAILLLLPPLFFVVYGFGILFELE